MTVKPLQDRVLIKRVEEETKDRWWDHHPG
jgi:co-chaperonin GroES (HSP10)